MVRLQALSRPMQTVLYFPVFIPNGIISVFNGAALRILW